MPMTRVPNGGYGELIGHGLSLVERAAPELFDWLKDTPFHCGLPPSFTGLHPTRLISDGRSYDDTAHVCYGFNEPRSVSGSTVVLFEDDLLEPWVVLHELGHVLDAQLHERVNGHQWWDGEMWHAEPIREWGRKNRYEAFAEAFNVYIEDRAGVIPRPCAQALDPATWQLFDELVAP